MNTQEYDKNKLIFQCVLDNTENDNYKDSETKPNDYI